MLAAGVASGPASARHGSKRRACKDKVDVSPEGCLCAALILCMQFDSEEHGAAGKQLTSTGHVAAELMARS